MKQILMILTLCALALNSNAQVESGTKYLGGTIGGSVRTTTLDYQTSSFYVQPTVGYFFNSNWMIGIGTEYNVTNAENYAYIYMAGSGQPPVSYSLKSTTIKVGPTVRYYYPVSSKFSVFGEGVIGAVFVKDKQTTEVEEFYNDPDSFFSGGTTVINHKKLRAGLAPGIVYFPTSKVGIELKANIISYQTTLGDEKAQPAFTVNNKSDFNATLSLQSTSIGVGVYF